MPRHIFLPVLATFTILLGFAQQEETLWAPKPAIATNYAPPHRPLTKLKDLQAKHAGKPNWRELIVDDEHLRSEFISSAPGTVVSKRLHPDTREWWVILDGQIRFEIEGQQPFTASKGSMVQVPMQTLYSMETIGDKPSLRFETNIAGAQTLFAKDAGPPKFAGMEWLSVRFPRKPGQYGSNNKPHITFEEKARALEEKRVTGTQRFVEDDRGTANFIYGHEKNLPPLNPADRGHYHPECAEYWLIMAGQIRYPIEGQGVIIANEGDVVYVPKFTFHAPRFHGPGPSCRLAMNGYPNISHLFEPPKSSR